MIKDPRYRALVIGILIGGLLAVLDAGELVNLPEEAHQAGETPALKRASC